jgi:DNA-directed RNA polymerase subunit RPC12/RpoP
MANLPGFMELVEIHERRWGTVQYPGRPTLSELMTSPVVACWIIDKRFIFSAHAYQGSLDDLVNDVITGKVADGRKLVRVFLSQQPTQFRAAIMYQSADSSEKKSEDTKTRLSRKFEPAHVMLPDKIIRTPAEDRVKLGRHSDWQPGREAPPIVVIKRGPPRYKYECPRCHAIQDAVKIEGSPKCPACGHEMVMKT